MKRRMVTIMTLLSIFSLGTFSCFEDSTIESEEVVVSDKKHKEFSTAVTVIKIPSETSLTTSVEPVEVPVVETKEEPSQEELLSEEEINLIALVTMAEAEGECEKGKRLVIDVILNRIDSIHFPNTTKEVIYQRNQFTSIWNGRVNRCYVTDEICQLVNEELISRTNYDVLFFTAGNYSAYGSPMFAVDNHYFSSY